MRVPKVKVSTSRPEMRDQSEATVTPPVAARVAMVPARPGALVIVTPVSTVTRWRSPLSKAKAPCTYTNSLICSVASLTEAPITPLVKVSATGRPPVATDMPSAPKLETKST